MKEQTVDNIKKFVASFASEITTVPYTIEDLKKAFPFHSIFFPDEALISFKQQRSVVTKMGMILYPKVAEIIARDQHKEVHLDHELTGEMDAAKIEIIDRMINELRAGRRTPDFHKETQEIVNARSGEKRKIRVIADLFVGDFKEGPLFLEIKSPLPNLDVCAESKKKMLLFRAFFENKNPQAFFAFPYNPFVHKADYKHPFTKRIMDIDNEVLVGEEMWDKLGGKGAYQELLKIIDEVKEELKQGPAQTRLKNARDK
jgi:hypothetical protein